MDDKECMEACVRDAKAIMADVFAAYSFAPQAYDAVARIATTLFDRRYTGNRGIHSVTDGVTGAGKGSGGSGCTGQDDTADIESEQHYYVFSRAYSGARIRTFLSSDAARRSLCRRLLGLAQWLESESTRGHDKELTKRYRQMAYDTIDAIEATLR